MLSCCRVSAYSKAFNISAWNVLICRPLSRTDLLAERSTNCSVWMPFSFAIWQGYYSHGLPISIKPKGWDKVILASCRQACISHCQHCDYLGNKERCEASLWDGPQGSHLLLFTHLWCVLSRYTGTDLWPIAFGRGDDLLLLGLGYRRYHSYYFGHALSLGSLTWGRTGFWLMSGSMERETGACSPQAGDGAWTWTPASVRSSDDSSSSQRLKSNHMRDF